MSFTQVMTVTTSKPDQLRDLMASWHSDQHGVAPGYRGARILQDRHQAGRFQVEVDFSSAEEAARNNDRPATQSWAAQLRALSDGEPHYGDFNLILRTD